MTFEPPFERQCLIKAITRIEVLQLYSNSLAQFSSDVDGIRGRQRLSKWEVLKKPNSNAEFPMRQAVITQGRTSWIADLTVKDFYLQAHFISRQVFTSRTFAAWRTQAHPVNRESKEKKTMAQEGSAKFRALLKWISSFDGSKSLR